MAEGELTKYFNDNVEFLGQWLRNLYPDAIVDTSSVKDIQASYLTNFERVHLFAGVGGWEYALQLAGWPEGLPVWTGSCPCQPFSTAGKRKGFDDDRHLWPDFRWLIGECRPPIVFGEQVASKDGRLWLDGVRADLEALGYVVGAADLCAAGVGAPHIRQRLYWGAVRRGSLDWLAQPKRIQLDGCGAARDWWPEPTDGSDLSGLADTSSIRWLEQRGAKAAALQGARPERAGKYEEPGHTGLVSWRPEGLCGAGDGGLGYSNNSRPQGWWLRRDGTRERFARPTSVGPWSTFDLIDCTDGKTRRFEPSAFPLAHGVSSRVGRIRAYGNAIAPYLATQFIVAFMEAVDDLIRQ